MAPGQYLLSHNRIYRNCIKAAALSAKWIALALLPPPRPRAVYPDHRAQAGGQTPSGLPASEHLGQGRGLGGGVWGWGAQVS